MYREGTGMAKTNIEPVHPRAGQLFWPNVLTLRGQSEFGSEPLKN